MRLMTDELRGSLPHLFATEDEPDPIARVRFFTPWSYWMWYGVEFDGQNRFYGVAAGFGPEVESFLIPTFDGRYAIGYGLSFDDQILFYGFGGGIKSNAGYFMLSVLEGLRGPGGLRVERDPCFEPTRLSSFGLTPEVLEEPGWWRDDP